MGEKSPNRYRTAGVVSYSIALTGTLAFLVIAVLRDLTSKGLAWEKELSVAFGAICALGALILLGLPLLAFAVSQPGSLSTKKLMLLWTPLVGAAIVAVVISLLDYFNLGL